MMIYGIIIAILVILLAGIALYARKLHKLNSALTNEVVKTKQTPIIIGKLDKYKEEELELLLSNPEIIDLLVRIYEYKIFMKTDSIRSLENTEEKVGFLNCLHSEHLFFYKLKEKLKKKKDKVGQSLV